MIDTYAAETAALGARYRWVQAFENKGELMGCSNPHPHGQIWASDALPNEAAAEDQHQRAYAAAHGTRLLADYARLEHARGERVVHQSAGWVAVVPYWAVWPFETLILPLAPVARLPDLTPAARRELGGLLVGAAVARTTGCSTCRFRIRWAGTARRLEPTMPTPGSCTRTSTRRCCGRRP